MRSCFSFFLLAFGFALFAGCGDDDGGCRNAADGTTCGNGAGTCQMGTCQVFCSELGIRAAASAGGGPYTFACEGVQRVVTRSTIIIERDVILDGEGKLIVDGNENHRVFDIPEPKARVTLSGMSIVRGSEANGNGGGISNGGQLIVERCTLSENSASNGHRGHGGAIYNTGSLELRDSTVSDNSAFGDWETPLLCFDPPCEPYFAGGNGGGIANEGGASPQEGPGTVTVQNSTFSNNSADGLGGGIANWAGGVVEIRSSTFSGNAAIDGGSAIASWGGEVQLANSVVDGNCNAPITSLGYNVGSRALACRLDQVGDLADVSAAELVLEALADNGGPTRTHALGEGSVAIDQVSEERCLDTEGEPLSVDQRGEPRDALCDAGSFERQP